MKKLISDQIKARLARLRQKFPQHAAVIDLIQHDLEEQGIILAD